jgi:hypothetical protein
MCLKIGVWLGLQKNYEEKYNICSPNTDPKSGPSGYVISRDYWTAIVSALNSEFSVTVSSTLPMFRPSFREHIAEQLQKAANDNDLNSVQYKVA